MATSSVSYRADSSAHVLHDLGEHLGQPGQWLSVEEAAATLGLNPSTIRRRIREQRLPSRRIKRPQGYSLRIFVADDQLGERDREELAPTSSASSAQLGELAGASSSDSFELAASLDPNERAQAMATYSRELLEPLVAALERSQARVSEQAETIGRLTAELAASEARGAALAASRSPEQPAPPTEPEPPPDPFPAPLPPHPNVIRGWRVWAAWLVGVLVAAGLLLGWPQ